MMRFAVWGLVVILLGTGCSGPRAAAPGTPGVLRAGEVPLSNVQLAFYRKGPGTYELVGFGITNACGEFGLLTEGALSSLWLEPGEYAVTLESVGTDPLFWPDEYRRPETTPLQYSWSAQQARVELNVPLPSAAK